MSANSSSLNALLNRVHQKKGSGSFFADAGRRDDRLSPSAARSLTKAWRSAERTQVALRKQPLVDRPLGAQNMPRACWREHMQRRFAALITIQSAD
jgi:hypothetical protein